MDTSDGWVVLDPAGQVVLICFGADAPEVVEEWRKRGYRTAQLEAAAVTAA